MCQLSDSEFLLFMTEFCKRIDRFPFYSWTLNECYSEDVYPSFDESPDLDRD